MTSGFLPYVGSYFIDLSEFWNIYELKQNPSSRINALTIGNVSRE
jgi:hypothetical protein